MSVTELVDGAIGSTLVALGGASIVAWSLRRKSSDHLLLFFGIWCCLYGIRLVALQSFVRTTVGGAAHKTSCGTTCSRPTTAKARHSPRDRQRLRTVDR
jgi:hypothetical protein